jgi:PKD repeat protein
MRLALALALLTTTAHAADVGVYGAQNNASWQTDVVNKLTGTGVLDSVGSHFVNNSTPSLADLQQYDAVLVYSDAGFDNNVAMGDVLADYVDAGGNVVMATFSLRDSMGLSIQGRFKTGGYLPVSTGGQDSPGGLTLSVVDALHPILAGVNSVNGGSASYHTDNLSVTSGANLVANWSNGEPLVVEWNPFGQGNVVVVNLYPPSSDARSDFWTASTDAALMFANALDFAAGGGAPIADAGGPYSGFEGTGIAMDGSLSTDADGPIASYAWDCEDDGVYDVTSSVATTTGCVYPDQGVYTVRLQVTDSAGNTDEATATVNVANANPTVVAITATGADEGALASLSVQATDVAADTLTVTWDFGDGSPTETGGTVLHAWDDDGPYTVTVTVDDEDGGSAVFADTVGVANLAPTLDFLTAPDGDEGELLSFAGGGLDVPADTVSYEWDFGDNSPVRTGSSTSHAYGDDGVYVVTLTLFDEDGGSSSHQASVTIGNLAPALTGIVAPTGGPEGSLLTFEASATDPGVGDSLTFTWDFGDGQPPTQGNPVDHPFPDDGTYTVTVTVDDGDGGSATDLTTVLITNADPTIAGNPSQFGLEGATWQYFPAASDPGLLDTHTWSLGAGSPAGMTVDPATGAVSWVPDYAAVASSPNPVVLLVTDDDGGFGSQSWTITVSGSDNDADGMADGWEDEVGLDNTDPTDGLLDPDGDGLNNLQEFQAGQDPFTFDGPTDPVLIDPLQDDEVADRSPDLLLANATDPQGEAIAYAYEVYADAALTTLLASGSEPEDASGQTEWKVDVLLPENADAWWRARATDGTGFSGWAPAEGFFVNEIEEAPPVPTPLAPVQGEDVAGTAPTFQFTNVEDPDRDDVTYEVQILLAADDSLSAEGTGIAGAAGPATDWELTDPLAEDLVYTWQVRAVDEHGLASDWSEPIEFTWIGINEPPQGVVFLEPSDAEEVMTASPVLVADGGVDPEGLPVQVRFEIDTSPDFDSAEFWTFSATPDADNLATWDLAATKDELPTGDFVYARVRGTDGDGVHSPWDVISIFVRGANTAPPIPERLLPDDGASDENPRPLFVIGHVEDPQGDDVTYDFIVSGRSNLTDPVVQGFGVEPGAGAQGGPEQTSWEPTIDLDGDLWWSARAVDEQGLDSGWAPARLLRIVEPEGPIVGDDDDSADGDDDDDVDEGCSCNSSLSGGAASLLLLLPLAVRRRR